MFLHKKFLKEHITDKEAVNDLAFLLLLKSEFKNSVLYNTLSNEDVGRLFGIDRRTVAKKLKSLQERGWLRRWGHHRKLISIEKEFPYKQFESGKKDVKWRNKFIKIYLNKEYCFRDYKHLVRGLLVKSFYQKKLYSKIPTKKREEISKKECRDRKLLWVHGFSLGTKHKCPEGATVNIGIRLLGKMMKVSKSTAQRTMEALIDKKLAIKMSSEIKLRGLAKNLIKKELPYGTFVYRGCVWTKSYNSYVI